MSGGASNWYQNRVLSRTYGFVPWTPPSTYYVALFTVNPTNAGGGTEVATVNTGYLRVAVPNNPINWIISGSSPTLASNALPVTFPPTQSVNWGLVTGFAIVDTPSGSYNMFHWAPLSVAKTVHAGDDPPSFPPGSIVVSLG